MPHRVGAPAGDAAAAAAASGASASSNGATTPASFAVPAPLLGGQQGSTLYLIPTNSFPLAAAAQGNAYLPMMPLPALAQQGAGAGGAASYLSSAPGAAPFLATVSPLQPASLAVPPVLPVQGDQPSGPSSSPPALMPIPPLQDLRQLFQELQQHQHQHQHQQQLLSTTADQMSPTQQPLASHPYPYTAAHLIAAMSAMPQPLPSLATAPAAARPAQPNQQQQHAAGQIKPAAAPAAPMSAYHNGDFAAPSGRALKRAAPADQDRVGIASKMAKAGADTSSSAARRGPGRPRKASEAATPAAVLAAAGARGAAAMRRGSSTDIADETHAIARLLMSGFHDPAAEGAASASSLPSTATVTPTGSSDGAASAARGADGHRGRPARQIKRPQIFDPDDTTASASAAGRARGRGRPPKAAAAPATPRLDGQARRPVGRPRKHPLPEHAASAVITVNEHDDGAEAEEGMGDGEAEKEEEEEEEEEDEDSHAFYDDDNATTMAVYGLRRSDSDLADASVSEGFSLGSPAFGYAPAAPAAVPVHMVAAAAARGGGGGVPTTASKAAARKPAPRPRAWSANKAKGSDPAATLIANALFRRPRHPAATMEGTDAGVVMESPYCANQPASAFPHPYDHCRFIAESILNDAVQAVDALNALVSEVNTVAATAPPSVWNRRDQPTRQVRRPEEVAKLALFRSRQRIALYLHAEVRPVMDDLRRRIPGLPKADTLAGKLAAIETRINDLIRLSRARHIICHHSSAVRTQRLSRKVVTAPTFANTGAHALPAAAPAEAPASALGSGSATAGWYGPYTAPDKAAPPARGRGRPAGPAGRGALSSITAPSTGMDAYAVAY